MTVQRKARHRGFALLACATGWLLAQAALAATPDFSGKWQSASTAPQLLSSDGKQPPLRAGIAMRSDDPVKRCLPPGVPRIHSNAQPFLILQRPDRLQVVYQFQRLVRQIYLEGSQPKDPDPAFFGNAVARWQGDALVVETSGFKAAGQLDDAGTPFSKALRTTERWRLRDANTLEVVVEINDSANFSAPWQATYEFRRQKGTELTEDVCVDRTWPERIVRQKQMEEQE